MRTESVKANLTKVLHKQNRGIFGTTVSCYFDCAMRFVSASDPARPADQLDGLQQRPVALFRQLQSKL